MQCSGEQLQARVTSKQYAANIGVSTAAGSLQGASWSTSEGSSSRSSKTTYTCYTPHPAAEQPHKQQQGV